MIIDNETLTAFIHIPKNSGMSVRRCILEKKAVSSINYLSKSPDKTELIDMTHMPLELLREKHPELMSKLEKCELYAVWRDPVSRFHSAMAQYIRNYTEYDYYTITKRDYITLCYDKILELEYKLNKNQSLDYKNIHFTPQVEYLYLDGQQVVKNVYAIKKVGVLMKHICERMKIDMCTLNDSQVNKSWTLRKGIPRLILKPLRAVFRIIPKSRKDIVKKALSGVLLVSPEAKFQIASLHTLNDRVMGFYKNDYKIKVN